MTKSFNNRYVVTFLLYKVDKAKWEWQQQINKKNLNRKLIKSAPLKPHHVLDPSIHSKINDL